MRQFIRLVFCLMLSGCFILLAYSGLVMAQGPIGQIEMWAGRDDSLPAGYLLCDAHCYPTTTYPALFNVISYTYGNSSGSFCVPDLRARVPIGANMGWTMCGGSCPWFWPNLGATGGEVSHTLTITEIPAHSHYSYWLKNMGASNFVQNGANWGGDLYGPTSNIGGGQAHNTLPPYVALNFIIAYTSTSVTATPTATPTSTPTPTATPTGAPPLATPAAYTNTLTTGTVLYQYSNASFGQIFIAAIGAGLVGTNLLMLVTIRKRRQ